MAKTPKTGSFRPQAPSGKARSRPSGSYRSDLIRPVSRESVLGPQKSEAKTKSNFAENLAQITDDFDDFISNHLKPEIQFGETKKISEALKIAREAKEGIRSLAALSALKRKIPLLARSLRKDIAQYSKITNQEELEKALKEVLLEISGNRGEKKAKYAEEMISYLIYKSKPKKGLEGDIDIGKIAIKFGRLYDYTKELLQRRAIYEEKSENIKALEEVCENPFKVIHHIEKKAIKKAHALFPTDLDQDQVSYEVIKINAGRKPESFLGDAPNITVINKYVSRTHAIVKVSPLGIINVRDIGTASRQAERIGSTNGTFINGEKMAGGSERIALAEDTISLAKHVDLNLVGSKSFIPRARELKKYDGNATVSTQMGSFNMNFTARGQRLSDLVVKDHREHLPQLPHISEKDLDTVKMMNALTEKLKH